MHPIEIKKLQASEPLGNNTSNIGNHRHIMSVVGEGIMFDNQYNKFNGIDRGSYESIIRQFKSSVVNAGIKGGRGPGSNQFDRKRKFAAVNAVDAGARGTDYLTHSDENARLKRSKTAPPTPDGSIEWVFGGDQRKPVDKPHVNRSKSLSWDEYLMRTQEMTPRKAEVISGMNPNVFGAETKNDPKKTALPSLSEVLKEASLEKFNGPMVRPRVAPPTVSLDYFDTYNPKDESWRSGVLDSIYKTKATRVSGGKHSRYGEATEGYTMSPRRDTTDYTHNRPRFDSRISPRLLEDSKNRRPFNHSNFPPCIQEKVQTRRKINFPYESNYTYLNKTYLHDVKKYPEYLELAHTLVELSQPQANLHSLHSLEERANHPLNQPFGSPAGTSSLYGFALLPCVPAMTPPSLTVYFHDDAETIAHHENRKTPVRESRRSSLPSMPATPPPSTAKPKPETFKGSPRYSLRTCISCGSDQSPCWRPSWSAKEGQLCNSCGLRYKKTSARCLNKNCRKIPAKGEWALMESSKKVKFSDGDEAYACLDCGSKVEVRRAGKS